MNNYKKIDHCRIGESKEFVNILNLGNQSLTGVFPKKINEPITSGPLELVWCADTGLLQLNHSYDPNEMYGHNYGYRSGLNQSMVDHLNHKAYQLEQFVNPSSGDVILDIGSNDATLLKAYSNHNTCRMGIDPTGVKFSEFYPADVKLLPHFFTEAVYRTATKKPAKIVTSIAMFYDLAAPIEFAREIEKIVADDGIWHFEQSYMPAMLRLNSYDTICHEHLEYYSLTVIKKILSTAGLKIIDVAMNNINGGSFSITAAKTSCKSYKENLVIINWLLEQEEKMGLNTQKPYQDFAVGVFKHREDLTSLIRTLAADGKKILGYGASTKGNVMLQFCKLDTTDILAIAEVNQEKLGCFTPGTHIPIISEVEARAMNPDYFLVLPWHFREGIVRREKEFLARGGKFIFPFPQIEIV